MRFETSAKIALGLITRNFDDPIPIIRFLQNAKSHGHTIDRVIVAYSHSRDETVLEDLQETVEIDLICVHRTDRLRKQMRLRGISPEAIEGMLAVPSWGRHREVPYGAYRNAVLFAALMADIDFLLFFDTDVEPRVLTGLEGTQAHWQEIDFVGTHLRSLVDEEVSATTSEYSGYYIIPPVTFPGMGDFLVGLGKGMALEYMEECNEHQCLNLGPITPGEPKPTDKPLGGNLGLDLRQAWRLAPFFSTIYSYSGLTVKGRGEDTLLGPAISNSGGRILDVDLWVFHDTYERFPVVPDIRRKPIRDRFYWACLGWIGRNPFLGWYLDRIGYLKTELQSETTLQRIGLEVGGEAAADHLQDARFKHLATAYEAAFAALPGTIDRYQRLIQGWQVLLQAIGRDRPPSELREAEEQDIRQAS
jgi:hypothetical protein